MAQEAQLIMLANLEAAIRLETAALAFDKPKEGSAGHDKLLAKIENWEHQLSSIRRVLKSRAKLDHVVYQANRFGPQAYAAKQSYKSRSNNVATVGSAVAAVNIALTELARELYAPPSLEQQALEILADTLKNMTDSGENELPVLSANDTQAMVQQLQPGSGAGGAGGLNPPGPMDTITLSILLIAMIRSWIAKHRKT